MYGLKRAFERFPFLAANIMATPPPIRRKPEKSAPLLWFRRNPVNVQYLKGAKKVLTAAAMTYVAALAVSFAQLLRFFLMVAMNTRRRD